MSVTETATLAGGCFWCLEEPFKNLRGVQSVSSGYTGGHVDDPSYEAVCEGTTGHAEAIQVVYDPDGISYEELLEVFFALHDPTTLNRQGPDVGSQYRSAVFYHDDEQRAAVEAYVDEIERSGEYEGIVTEIEPLETFWEAEEYHQDYYEKNPENAYCRVNIGPKMQKVREKFGEKVAED
ncbi:peptide-methionine (S)-S-oxide reductase MsrA [Haloarculaceae archaeon H-GB2-1]|nr:peptide-methionine (S)-S-oxide reductase MsrA [Haloarculaceae archaeon H-GB1-1]MEA5387019.1 peptide-methionine (S)-S-oxide reductase MsrA [Haloarculaceae archaeon H-GB11]MEA5408521.1 peptide-methionine (S)-S-oxide reductase MsrA [Haloarculaceae archaeon H-GB2-1]